MENENLSPINLLLVEDNPVDAQALQLLLGANTEIEVHPKHASTLKATQHLLDQNQFDIILLDLELSDSSGIATYNTIQRQTEKTAIIVVSASDDTHTAKEAVKQGAQDYLIKGSINHSLLSRAIIYAIERQKIHAELEKTAERLNFARQAAECSNQAKSDLIQRASREIRRALNCVEGGSTLLRSMELDPKQKKCLEFINAGVSTLHELIETTQLSNLRVGPHKIDILSFNLHNAFEEAKDNIRAQLDGKALRIESNVESRIPETVQGAPKILIDVVTTLALYTGNNISQGSLTIDVSQPHENRLKILIKGVNDDTHSHGLNSNAGLPAMLSENFGLATCQELCDQLGWNMSLSDEDEQTFFCLTLAAPSAQHFSSAADDDEKDPNRYRDLSKNYPLKILIAEDSDNGRKVAKAMLNLMGYEPAFVADGVEAVTALDEDTYDLLLMDIQMPEMDGLSATHIIREKHSEHAPFIVALTAFATEEDRKNCLDAGLNDHMSKPLSIEKLVPLIKLAYQRQLNKVKAV